MLGAIHWIIQVWTLTKKKKKKDERLLILSNGHELWTEEDLWLQKPNGLIGHLDLLKSCSKSCARTTLPALQFLNEQPWAIVCRFITDFQRLTHGHNRWPPPPPPSLLPPSSLGGLCKDTKPLIRAERRWKLQTFHLLFPFFLFLYFFVSSWPGFILGVASLGSLSALPTSTQFPPRQREAKTFQIRNQFG